MPFSQTQVQSQYQNSTLSTSSVFLSSTNSCEHSLVTSVKSNKKKKHQQELNDRETIIKFSNSKKKNIDFQQEKLNFNNKKI